MRSRSTFIAAFLCLILAFSAGAWGGDTHEFICEEAVARAWGNETVEACFSDGNIDMSVVCDVVGRANADSGCDPMVDAIHPAVIPYVLFNDTELHFDYSNCSIPERDAAARQWICETEGVNLAGEQASIWLAVSEEETDACARAYAFCIASNYLADSYMPLFRVKYALESSIVELEGKVDYAINRGEVPWKTYVYATFQYNQRRNVQRYDLTDEDIEAIIKKVASRAFVEADAGGDEPAVNGSIPVIFETCFDGVKNQDETGVDCGGPCGPCVDSTPCLVGMDCVSRSCVDGFCRKPSCSDGVVNQGESGVDCGGPCSPCGPIQLPLTFGGLVHGLLSYAVALFAVGALLFVIAAPAILLILKQSHEKIVGPIKRKKKKKDKLEVDREKREEKKQKTIEKQLDEIEEAEGVKEELDKTKDITVEQLDGIKDDLNEIISALEEL